MPSLWIGALKEFNLGKDSWCVPRKGTADNDKVRRIMKGEAASPVKKPAVKADMATSPMKTEAPKAKTPEAPKAKTPEAPKAKTPVAPKAKTPKAKTPKAKTPKIEVTSTKKAESKAKTKSKSPPMYKEGSLEEFMALGPEDLVTYEFGRANEQGEKQKGLIAQFVGKVDAVVSDERRQFLKDVASAIGEIGNVMFKLYKKDSDDSDRESEVRDELLDLNTMNSKKFKFINKIAGELIDMMKRYKRQTYWDSDAIHRLSSALISIHNAIYLALYVNKNIDFDIYSEHSDGGGYSTEGPTEFLEHLSDIVPGNLLMFEGEAERDEREEGDDDDEYDDDGPYQFTISGRVTIMKTWDTVSRRKAEKLADVKKKAAAAPRVEARKEQVQEKKGRVAEAAIPQGKKNAKIYTRDEFRAAFKKVYPNTTEAFMEKNIRGPNVRAYFARTKLHYTNIK